MWNSFIPSLIIFIAIFYLLLLVKFRIIAFIFQTGCPQSIYQFIKSIAKHNLIVNINFSLSFKDLFSYMIISEGTPIQLFIISYINGYFFRVSTATPRCKQNSSLFGFRDDKFDKIFGGRDKLGDYMTELGRQACLDLFSEYRSLRRRTY